MARRGRPTREPSAAEIEKVKQLAKKKTPISDIAKLLNRSVPNLRKYFSKELFSEKKSKPDSSLPFKITERHRQKVIRYIGCKMKPEDVARALGCSLEQLEESFPEEIACGHAKARADVIDHLHDQMEEGLVGATNRLEAMTAIPDESAAAAPGYVGKKAAAKSQAAAAVAGGSKFAPRPAPKLVVDNGS